MLNGEGALGPQLDAAVLLIEDMCSPASAVKPNAQMLDLILVNCVNANRTDHSIAMYNHMLKLKLRRCGSICAWFHVHTYRQT